MIYITKLNRYFSILILLFSLLRGGTELTLTAFRLYTSGVSADLVSGYFNENATGLTLVFTPDADYTSFKLYAELSATTVGGCTEANFDGTELELTNGTFDGNSMGTGTSYDPVGNFSQTSHTIFIPAANILTRVGGAWNSGEKLYIAIKFDGNTAKWACPKDAPTAGTDASQSDGARHFFAVDTTDPTLTSILEHTVNEQIWNNPDYVKTPSLAITVGAESISTGGITWTAVSGGGGTVSDSDALDGATAGVLNMTTDPGLVDGTVYNISFTLNDAAGNNKTYTRSNVLYDITAPTVTSVVSEEANGDMLAEGAVADFYVEFSENINFVGAPQITLQSNDGATTTVNAATFANDTDKAYFDWTVPDGAYSVYLDYETTTSLSAGTTIKDLAGNAATLTLPAPPAWGAQGTNASLSQAATGGSFGVDGDDPAAFSVGAVVTTGGNVTADYWNGSNTGVSVTVPVANDNSLTDGTVQLRSEADGNYEDIGGSYTILVGDLNTNITMTASGAGSGNTDVTELNGYTQADVLGWKAIITDKSGNATTATASATTLTVDTVAPTVNTVTSSDGDYKLAESVDVVVNFTENVLISGTPQLTLNTDNTPGTADAAVDKSGLTGGAVTFAYTVGATHYSADLDYESTTALTAGTFIRDAAGNDADLALPALGTFAAAQAVKIDGVSPAAFTTGTVITVGAPIVAGYLNEDNTGVDVTVPIANDASLENGKLYIQAKIGANNYASVSSAYTIQSADLNTNKTITVAESDLDGITGFTLGAVISFVGMIEDFADGAAGTGNQTVGAASATTLIVDQNDPAAFTTGAVTTLTETVTAGKWNSHNTGLTIVVPIANEATLEDGDVQIIAKIATTAYEDIGASVAIANGDLGGNITVTITAALFEAINVALVDGDVVTLNSKINDVAGNITTGTASGTTLTVDQTPPTVSFVSSDDDDSNPFKVGDVVNLKVKFDEIVNVATGGGIPFIGLDTDEAPGNASSTAPYASGTASVDIIFGYTVAANEYSADLNYINTTSLSVNGGTIRDAAGNNATLILPGIADNNALKQKKDIWIDGVAPAAGTVDAVLTVGGTLMPGFWNEDNTSATVKILLASTDVSLEGGTVQISGEADGNYANVGASGTISAGDVTAGFKTITLSAANIEGLAGYTDQYPNPDVINFKAIVSDKAGNSTTHAASATTLTVDETDPAAFTVGSILTVSGEVVPGYWNEDNNLVNVGIPVANDGTLENGRIMVEGEAEGAYEYIGSGSLYNAAAYVPSDHDDYYKDWTTIAAGDVNTTKTVSINGNPLFAADRELEELTNFSDGDEIGFRAIIMDAAGNTTTGTISATTLVVDQTDPDTPIIELKNSSDTGIADWDNLTKDDTPTFTLTNLTNTDSVFLKIAVDVATLATDGSIVVRDVSTSNTKELTPATHANGTYLVSALAKDVAGNWGLDATKTFVRIDVIPPDVPNKPDMMGLSDTGFKDNDNITKTTQPQFIFTGLSATIDSLRLVIDGGGAVGRDSIMSQVTTDTFKVSIALASGYHTAGVIAIDSAGNVQDTSAVLPFVVDNVAPSKPTAPDMTVATDYGQSNTDNITKEPKPNFDITNIEIGSFINLYHVTPAPVTTLAAFDTVDVGVTTLTIVPLINMDDGTYTMYATSEDTAGNTSQSDNLTNVIIDATVPTISASYYNRTIQTVYNTYANKFKTDSVNFGKGNDEVDFIAKMSEPAGTTPEPTLDVTYGNNSTDSFAALAKTSKADDDSTWIWKFDLPTATKNDGAAKVSFTAYDIAGNLAIAFTDTQKFTVDNTPPVAFTTGVATVHGDTNVSMVVEAKTGWFINRTTDSVKVLVNIDATDNSLVGGGYVDIQATVRNKMVGNWASINSNYGSNPFFPQDSTEGLGTLKPFFRKKDDITAALTGSGLVQGDTIDVRALIYDKALNLTTGTLSESYFVLDTIAPTIGIFATDTLYTIGTTTNRLRVNQDTTWTNDTISFAVKEWTDPGSATKIPSGLDRYEYALYQSADNTNANYTLFRDFREQTSKMDSVFIDTFALTHNRNYLVRVRGIDVAGNISSTANDSSKSDFVLRYNARPDTDSIPRATANEDVLWEQLLTVNDKDLLTIRSDEFIYSMESYFSDTTQTPWITVGSKIDTITAAVSTSGKMTFTPTKWDTATYIHRVFITDKWGLKDTVDVEMLVKAVNDAPLIDLSSLSKLEFLEGANSDSVNLTQFVTDEDNTTASLNYTFKIASTLPGKGGFPIAKTGFLSDVSAEFKKAFIAKLVDEFPASTIIQKNNAFVIYPANVIEFRDPLKVDSLLKSDSVFSWITQTDTASLDTNYYTSSDMMVEYTVTDPDGLSGRDTVLFSITPINDSPVWAGLRDTVVKENDSLYIDFANYLTDVDDSTLTLTILPLSYDANVTVEPTKTFEKKATGYVYSSNARKDTVKFKPSALWFKKDSGPWNPSDTTSNQIKFQITAADGDTSAIDTFIVRVQRVPRPEISMYVVQNNAFTNYYEIFLIDSVGKTKDLTLKVQSKSVTLDKAAAFTYVGHYDFKTKGTYTFEVDAKGLVGDTVITQNLGLALAKMYGTWSGKSADGQFNVIGGSGAVDFDQSIMILDSTLFEPYFNDRASYLLGNEAFRFKKSVEISLPGDDEEMALYQRSIGSGWIELPSITQGNRVLAYTQKMGYFRMGPKTLIVPGQTSLQQNYPNPFNPVTTIMYDLGFIDGPFQRVNMTVYDILGRNVKTLVNQQQGIGRYRVKWNGRDQNGVPVASGVYFVHLLTDMGRSQTKKIMLMR